MENILNGNIRENCVTLAMMSLAIVTFRVLSAPTEEQWPSVILALFLIALIIMGFSFWLWMLIDVIRRPFASISEKALWLLVVGSTGILGPLIYYFLIKRKDNYFR